MGTEHSAVKFEGKRDPLLLQSYCHWDWSKFNFISRSHSGSLWRGTNTEWTQSQNTYLTTSMKLTTYASWLWHICGWRQSSTEGHPYFPESPDPIFLWVSPLESWAVNTPHKPIHHPAIIPMINSKNPTLDWIWRFHGTQYIALSYHPDWSVYYEGVMTPPKPPFAKAQIHYASFHL